MEEKREEGDTQQNQSSDDQSSNMVDNKRSSGDSQDQDSNVVDKNNSRCSNTNSDDNEVSNIVDNKNTTIKSYSDDGQDQDSNVVEKNGSSCSSKSSSGDGKLESKITEIPAEQEKLNSSNGDDEAQEDASSMVADDSEETKISESAADVKEQEERKSSGGIEAQEDHSDSTLAADDSGPQELDDPQHDNKGQHPDVGTVKDQSEDDTELKNSSLSDERKTSTSDGTDMGVQDSFRKIVDDTSTKEVPDDVAIDIPPDTSTHDVSDCVAIDIPPDTSTQDVSASRSSNSDLDTKCFPNESLEEVEDADTGDLDSTLDSAQMENSRSTTENESVKEHVPDADSKSPQSEKVTEDTLNTSKGQDATAGESSSSHVNFADIPISDSCQEDLVQVNVENVQSESTPGSQNSTAGDPSISQVISADIPTADSCKDLIQVNVENVQTEFTPESQNATAGNPSSIYADIANADSSKILVQVDVGNVQTESTPESHNTTAGESSSSQVISADIPISDSCKEDPIQVNVENVETESTPESQNATAGDPSSISVDIANADSSKILVQVDVGNVQTESNPGSHNTTAGESSSSQVISADIPISDSCKEDPVQVKVENVETESTLESQVVIVEVGSAAVSDVVSSAIENNSDELENRDGYQESLEVPAATDNIDSLIQHAKGESSKANQNHEDPDTDSNEVGLCSHNAQNMLLERQTAPSVSTLPWDPAPVVLDESATKQISEISSSDNNAHQKSHLEISDQPVDENKLCEGSTETVVGDKTAYTETKKMERGKAVAEPHWDPIVQDDHNAGVCHHDAQNVSFEEHQTTSLGMQASSQESFNLDNSQSTGQSLQPHIEVMDSTSQNDTVKKQQHSVSDDADPSESGLPKPDTSPAPSIGTQALLPDPKSAAKDDIPTEKKPPTVPVHDTSKYPAASDEETRLALRRGTVSLKSRLAETETENETKPVSNLSEIVEEEPSASQGSRNPERRGKGKSWLLFKCCQFDDPEDDGNDDKAIQR